MKNVLIYLYLWREVRLNYFILNKIFCFWFFCKFFFVVIKFFVYLLELFCGYEIGKICFLFI